MARKSMFHLTGDQWIKVIMQAAYANEKRPSAETAVKFIEKYNDMTHHERRLYVRHLMKDRAVAHTLKCITL